MVQISCVMSNYNTPPEILREAIDSILNQTFKDFELIIVDDYSTDQNSLNQLKKYLGNNQVKIIYNEKNLGLAGSLNRGIKEAKGKYIARMDTDDISLENRFDIEYSFMEKHTDVDICSSYAQMFFDSNGLRFFTPFYKDKFCKCSLLFSTCLCHPAVMIRKSFLTKFNLYYDETFYCSQDFDMWARCSHLGKIEVINRVLLKYRVHNKQLSSAKKDLQIQMAKKVLEMQLKALHVQYDKNEFNLHMMLAEVNNFSIENLKPLISWIKKLIIINDQQQIYDKRAFKIILKNRVFNLWIKNTSTFKERLLLIKNPFFWDLSIIYSFFYRIFYPIIYRTYKL